MARKKSNKGAEARKLFKQGLTIEEIASKLSTSNMVVVKWLKDELKPLAREMRQNGKSQQEIMDELGIGRKAISLWTGDIELTEEQTRDITNTYRYNVEAFTKEDATSYYLLGAWMSDGNVKDREDRVNTLSLSIAAKDREWIELINNLICPEKSVLAHGENCHQAIYNSTEIANWLVSKGCGPRKSRTLQFPDVPKEYLVDFIRGYFDGDGSISFIRRYRKDRRCYEQNRNMGIYTGSEKFAKGLSVAFSSIGIDHSIRDRFDEETVIEGRTVKRTGPVYAVRCSSGADIVKLCELLYYTDDLICLPRKLKIAKDLLAHWYRKTYCKACNEEIGKFSQYCEPCKVQRERERARKKNEKRKEKREADKLLKTHQPPN